MPDTQPCAICGIANKSHFTHLGPFGPDYHEYQPPVVVTPARLTNEYLSLTPLQKWNTLALHGLLGTDELWIADMREHLVREQEAQSSMQARIDELEAENAIMREGLEAIQLSGVHRAIKWAGMNAHDIARVTLSNTPGGQNE